MSGIKDGITSLVKIPGKIIRNRALIQDLAIALYTGDKQTVRQRVRSAHASLWNKILADDESAKLEFAKGQARKLLDDWPWIVSHLRRTPHFGILQEMVMPTDPTRLYYVGAQLEIALDLKKKHRALGLGSPLSATLNGETVGLPKSTTGLELLQLWSVLLSAGHLFGTYATERALAYRLRRNPRLADQFLDSIPNFARDVCDHRIRAGSMYSMTLPLAIWIACKNIQDSSLKNICLAALTLYERKSSSDQLRRFKALHNRVRQVAYLRLQGICSFVIGTQGQQPDMAMTSMSATPRITEDSNLAFDPEISRATSYSRLLESIQAYHESEFFVSPLANKLVLRHLREFKTWWSNQDIQDIPIDDRVVSLFQKPVDWPSEQPLDLSHVLRLEFPTTENKSSWVEDVRKWIGPDDGSRWQQANFFLSETDFATVVDIFSPDSQNISTSAAIHVAEMLASIASNSISKARSVARFGQWLLSKILNKNYESFLTSCGSQPELSLAIIEGSIEKLSSIGATCRMSIPASPRRDELLTALSLARTFIGDLSPRAILLFTGTLQIFPKEGQDAAAELDGVVAIFFEDHVKWLICESKSGKQRGARKQIDDTRSLFEIQFSDIEQSLSSDSQIAWMSGLWPVKQPR